MGNGSKTNNTRIFTLNELSLRLSPALAEEIGLNESIVLLQIEYWIHISNHFIEERRWTYQSVRQMQEKAFPFWSIATISRAVKSLLDKGLIIEGNYNKVSYDNTRWFALNHKELSNLKSIMIRGYKPEENESETPPFQNETPPFQNETPLFQNETTIPQITPQITPEITPQNVRIVDEDDTACVRENSLQKKTLEADETSYLAATPDNPPMGLKAITFAEVNLQRRLSEYEREKLIEWCIKFAEHPECTEPETMVIAGLERCVIKNDLSSLMAYLNTILENFKKNNIVSVGQVAQLDEQRKKAHEDNKQGGKRERVRPIHSKRESTSGTANKEEKYANFYL